MKAPSPVRLSRASLAAAVGMLCTGDPGLAAIVATHGMPPLWARPTGFATLGRMVLEQQVSLEAAATLWRRLDAEIPGGFAAEPVAELGVDALRRLGLTRQKAAYLHGLATEVATGALDLPALAWASDADVLARLTRLHGIGPWTASVYLLFALRRPDVWPPGDLALHLALQQMERWPALPARTDVNRRAERWAPGEPPPRVFFGTATCANEDADETSVPSGTRLLYIQTCLRPVPFRAHGGGRPLRRSRCACVPVRSAHHFRAARCERPVAYALRPGHEGRHRAIRSSRSLSHVAVRLTPRQRVVRPFGRRRNHPRHHPRRHRSHR